MKIIFARHGESQANLLHEISNRGLQHGLTLKGREQAQTLAQKLQGQAIGRIYSSPLLRAIETSVIIAQQLGLAYEVVEALREFDCGIFEGRSDEVAWQAWRELVDAWTIDKDWDRRLEGGESLIEVRSRFEPFIQELVDQFSEEDERIVCISHGGLYRVMLPSILVNIDEASIGQYDFDYTNFIMAELRSEGLVVPDWKSERAAPDISLRPYQPSDLQKAVAIWRASKRAAFPYVEVQQLYTLENDMEYFQTVLAAECEIWLAEGQDQLLGLMALRDDLIDQLFVRVGVQRQGIGSALVAQAKDRSPDQLRAYTFQKNVPARNFFEKHGFVMVRAGLSPPPENEPDLEYLWSPRN